MTSGTSQQTDSQTSDSPFTLADFVRDVEQVLDQRPSLPITIKEVGKSLFKLCSDDSWLPESHRATKDDCYARHLLHKDRQNRFVVLALVWKPGQATPIHDHSCWGLMGILQNALEEIAYERLDDGSRPGFAELRELQGGQVVKGSTSYLLPPYQEVHKIGNNTEKDTISIHIYGRDIDEVNVFDLESNEVRPMRIKYFSPDCGGEDFVI
ncbi:MAG: cysteine dioxygenase family protein [Planctomycetota bacterium]